jgi:hypothetical protein
MMPKTPAYLVVDLDNEAVVATGSDSRSAIKDLETSIDADPEDSWAETYLLCHVLHSLKIERKPHIVVPPALSHVQKSKPPVKKTKKAKKKNGSGHPRHRKNCKNPACQRGYLGRSTSLFCSTECSNYYSNTIRNYLLAVDPDAHIKNHPWLKNHSGEILRVQRSCTDPKNNTTFARRVRATLQTRNTKAHEKGTTILKNTPTLKKPEGLGQPIG